jgi:hypothetical protein
MNTTEEKDRVRRNTSEASLRRIDQKLAASVRARASQARPELEQRITALDREWDVERILEANASTLALTGLVLGVTVNRRWLWLTGGVLGFLLQHAVQGWCPPLPLLRRAGVRTRLEIDREKFALKILRGDFEEVIGADGASTGSQVRAVREAVEA